jgi:glutamine synthetase
VISLDELRTEAETGAIDTVVVAFTDMQGRLMGKRVHAESDAERFPHSLREAIAALEEGTLARQALGDEVVDHLSQLRAHGAAALRRGRHLLRAGAAVRAWLDR